MTQEIMAFGLNTEALEEWREYRKAKKKPLSPLAEKKTIKLMLQYQMEEQQLLVDRAIQNDWQGLHPLNDKQRRDAKPNKRSSTRHRSIQDDLEDTSWAD